MVKQKNSHSPIGNTPNPVQSIPANEMKATGSGYTWLLWQMWGTLLVIGSGCVGYYATNMLLKIPTLPECQKTYWPLASASTRLYCAQLKAENNTLPSIQEAFELVKELPSNHPLKEELKESKELWAKKIVALGEKKFHQGDLKAALEMVSKVPNGNSLYKFIPEKIQKWESTWLEGEEIYRRVESEINKANWKEAFIIAVELTEIENNYWSQTKYEEIIENLTQARLESKQLDGLYYIFRKGGIDNLLKTIEKSQKISKESYAYKEAQDLIGEAKNKILQYIDSLIETKNWDTLLTISGKISSSDLVFQQEVADWQIIANAGKSAKLRTDSSLDLAISEAEKIEVTSPIYSTAQDFIRYWELEKEGLQILSKARDLATPGTIKDYLAAISEAESIASGNPVYPEAQADVRNWYNRISIIEDTPILNRAKTLARGGNIPSYQRAISQASLIGRNRALYRESQKLIRQWQWSIQKIEDQPILNEAIALGNSQNYPAAIRKANEIRRGRALHNEAQGKITIWQREIDARQYLQEARQIAAVKNPESLLRAIRVARKVHPSTDVRSQSVNAINKWSYEILAIARNVFTYNNKEELERAIKIAKLIPYGTSAYQEATGEIRNWKDELYRLNTPAWPPLESIDSTDSTPLPSQSGI